jgi:diguanylate cyclase (GGDEF)-like protein/PAS domain S-box-containing protein
MNLGLTGSRWLFHFRVLKILRNIFLTSEIARNHGKTKVVGLRITLQMVGVLGLLFCLKALAWNNFVTTYSYALISGWSIYILSVLSYRAGKTNFSGWLLVFAIWVTFVLVLIYAGKVDSYIFYGYFVIIFLIGMFLHDLQLALLVALIAGAVFGHFMVTNFAVLPAPVQANPQTSLTLLHTVFLALAAILSKGIGRELDKIFDQSKNLSQQFQAIFDQSADSIFLTDVNFIIQKLNPRAAELVDQPPEEVIGKNIYQYVPPDAKEQVEELASDTLENGKISKIKMSFLNREGDKLHIQISANMIYKDDETPDHIQIILRDITERKQVEERIQRLALQDHLTKVDNRLSLHYRLSSLIAKMHRDGGRFALVYFDLNNFKAVNDRYGHYIGDQLLIAFTKRLHGATREEDFLARMGGDEFVLILENYLFEDELEITLTRISSIMAEPFKIGDHLIYLETSYGVSCYPEDGDDFETLMKVADSAMYNNKRAARVD